MMTQNVIYMWEVLEMYVEHRDFEKPSDESIKLWRYMDFTKFVYLLHRKALFFSRADRLDDPFEGSYSRTNVRLRPLVYEKIPQKQLAIASNFYREMRRYVVINSWHMNEHESDAMWKLYLKTDKGIAIQSTFSKLTESFKNYKDPVYIGIMKYIDYETDWLPEGNLFFPFLHKRKSFSHENEIRAIVSRVPSKKDEKGGLETDLSQEAFQDGLDVMVELDILVERVVTHPAAPTWFVDLVKSVTNKYGLGKPVDVSKLSERPVY